MSKSAEDLARMIIAADATRGDAVAVEQVATALGKVIGTVLAGVLVRHGDAVFDVLFRRATAAIEEEARATASLAIAQLEGIDEERPSKLN